MKYLSINWHRKTLKTMYSLTFIIGYAFLIYIILFAKNPIAYIPFVIFVFIHAFETYLFLKSKDIQYDKEFLYVRNKKEWLKLPIDLVHGISYYPNNQRYCKIFLNNNEYFSKNVIIYQNAHTITNKEHKIKIKEILKFAENAREREIQSF